MLLFSWTAVEPARVIRCRDPGYKACCGYWPIRRQTMLFHLPRSRPALGWWNTYHTAVLILRWVSCFKSPSGQESSSAWTIGDSCATKSSSRSLQNICSVECRVPWLSCITSFHPNAQPRGRVIIRTTKIRVWGYRVMNQHYQGRPC